MMIIFMVINTLFLVQFIYVLIVIILVNDVNNAHPHKGTIGLL